MIIVCPVMKEDASETRRGLRKRGNLHAEIPADQSHRHFGESNVWISANDCRCRRGLAGKNGRRRPAQKITPRHGIDPPTSSNVIMRRARPLLRKEQLLASQAMSPHRNRAAGRALRTGRTASFWRHRSRRGRRQDRRAGPQRSLPSRCPALCRRHRARCNLDGRIRPVLRRRYFAR